MTLRSRPLACVLSFFMLLSVAGAQDTGDHSGPTSRPTSREQLRLREKWFRKGRVVRGKATAALLYSAHKRKLQQRASKRAQSQLGTQAFPETNNAVKPWLPLGPAPLASNATGPLGQQDYGPVVGRATAVVVDPGDPTGNLVYVGGAYAAFGSPRMRPPPMPPT